MFEAQIAGVVVKDIEGIRKEGCAVRVREEDVLDLGPPVRREVEVVDVLGDLRLIEQAADGEFGGEAAGGGPPADQARREVSGDNNKLLGEFRVVAGRKLRRQ